MATLQDIRELIAPMALDDPFNYYFLHRANVSVRDTGHGTMCVYVKNGRFHLDVSQGFLKYRTIPELYYLLRHEVLHIVLHHVDGRFPSEDVAREDRYNKAMDLAINSIIPVTANCKIPYYKKEELAEHITKVLDRIPDAMWDAQVGAMKDPIREFLGELGSEKLLPVMDGMLATKANVLASLGKIECSERDTMGVFPEQYGFDRYLSTEQFLELLPKKEGGSNPKDGGSGGGGSGGGGGGDPITLDDLRKILDSHDQFTNDPQAFEDIKNLVSNLTKLKMWGNMAGKAEDLIKAAQSREVPWNKTLHYQYGRHISNEVEITYKKPHKSLGYPYPGKTTTFQAGVHVYVDASGSVSDEEMEVFLGETSWLATHVPVYMNYFDAELAYPKPVLFTKNFTGRCVEVLGRGGTDITVAFEDAAKRKAKAVVILTDGYAPEPEYYGIPASKIIWVITRGGNPASINWRGKVIYLRNPNT